MHPGDTALAALEAAVTGLPTTGANVEIEPGRPIDELPAGATGAIATFPVSDDATETTHARGQRCEMVAAVVTYAHTREHRSESRREIARAVSGLSVPMARYTVDGVTFERQAEKNRLFAAVIRVRIQCLSGTEVAA